MAIKISNINPLKGVRTKIDREVKKVLIKQGELLVKESYKRAPFRTGRLRNSLDRIVVTFRYGWRLIFGSGVSGGQQVPYASYQEYGTDKIKPVRYLRGSLEFRLQKLERAIVSAIRRAFR